MVLEIFLMGNVLLIGVLITLAVQHALAHYRPHPDDKPGVANSNPKQPGAKSIELPSEIKDKLLRASQANFQEVLDKSAADLDKDLKMTSLQLNKLLSRLGGEIVGNELERYRLDLETIRQEAEAAVKNAQANYEAHQADLKAKLAEEIATEKEAMVAELLAEKQQIIGQLDTKIADGIASFLVETLQHNVDLGAQTAYLTAQLEEHKADLIREIAGSDKNNGAR
jgi:hypothetical protein